MKNKAITKLSSLTNQDFVELGYNGYISEQFIDICIDHHQIEMQISLIIKNLDEAFVKHWDITDRDIEMYNEMISEGNSFGIYEDAVLVAIAICEEKKWNNSLYIENIIVAEKSRRKGFGKLLINEVLSFAKAKNFRVVELETQNTNVPAVRFYQSQGFNITGLKTNIYDYNTIEKALYMTYDLKNH